MVTEHPHAELLEQLNANIDVHRVLWIAVQLRAVWAVDEIFRDEPELVQQVVRQKLIRRPKGSEVYEFTDKGCKVLGRWFESVYRRRGQPGFQEHWKRVTGREH
jgi:hypothetical protein